MEEKQCFTGGAGGLCGTPDQRIRIANVRLTRLALVSGLSDSIVVLQRRTV